MSAMNDNQPDAAPHKAAPHEAAPHEALIEVVDGVATITLNRPAALNALTYVMKGQLLEGLHDLANDRSVRAIVLTGAGRAFSAGQDLRERLADDAPPLDEELGLRYNPIILAIREAPQPVIAAVNGVAAGAGASLAFACDLRIASESASFVLAFGRIGLVPDSGATWTLPRLVGAARAADIALLGDTVSASEALSMGLVSRVVAPDALLREAADVAARIAVLAPGATTMTKRLLGLAFDHPLEAALAAEAEAQGIAGRDPDHREGLAAFMEKRTPRFSSD